MKNSKNLRIQIFIIWIPIALIVCLFFYLLYNQIAYHEIIAGNSNVNIRDEAPFFELVSTKGDVVSIKDLRGKAIILFFFSATCNSCIEEVPFWYKVKIKQENPNLEFIGISTSSIDEIEKFLTQTKLDFPVLLDDGSIRKQYNVSMENEIFLVDREGIIIFRSNDIPIDEGLTIFDEKLKNLL